MAYGALLYLFIAGKWCLPGPSLTSPCIMSLLRVAYNICAGIGAVPIVDAEGRVVGIYSRSDITFLATAADPGAVLEVT